MQEAYKVLEAGGLMIFNSLIKPWADITNNARRYVYYRLLFESAYRFTGYREAYCRVGIEVL